MNCIYRSLWNAKTGTCVAVSENATSAGKKTSSCTSTRGASARFPLQALAVSVMLSFGTTVYAGPTGGVVAAGSASINSGAGNTTITQSTQNVAINWQSFNIASGEAVRFVQPNSNSVALNRVLGADPSSILGSLSANGKVFLVNPNGILFGKGASVNVGGLVASALNVTDSDFMAGNYKFSGAGSGAVVNQGSINADGGYVALLGANVANNGVISAKLGSVALAAGNAITLDLAGDGLLNVTVNQGAVNALVQNGGLIQADGGQVLLSAQAAGNLLSSAVNNTGVIQAQTLQNHKGTIKLMGDMQTGTVNVGGTLDASAPAGGDGGFVETSAAHVKVADNAVVTTKSAQGKTGSWLIDPTDFTIGTDIAGGTLSALLVTNSVNIDTVAGPIPPVPGSTPPLSTFGSGLAGVGAGDINVNAAVTWTATPSPTTLTLNAAHDVNVNAALNATTGSFVFKAGNDINMNAAITTTTGSIHSTPGRDLNVNAAVTQTTGDFIACCGRDININAAMTMTTGDILLRAGPDGSGLGVPGVGGTVTFAPGVLYTVTDAAPHTIKIQYTPTSYNTPNNYSSHFTGTGATLLQQQMLVFLDGSKTYDGTNTANLALKSPLGTGAALTVSPTATATFDSVNAGAAVINYSGYTLTGVNAAQYAIADSCVTPGTLSATIAQRPVTVKADDATKVYGQTFTPANTAFTVPVPPAPGETITSVNEATPGTPATVPVATYLITPSNATGATFNPANYIITYQAGNLVVTPAPLTVTASNVTKSYGQAPALTGYTTTALVNGETVTSVTETSPGQVVTAAVVGSPYVITPSSAAGTFTPSNYTISYVNGALAVTPIPLTVTASDVTKVYGQAPALTGFTTTALVNGETVGSVTETSPGQVATAAVVGSPYAITPSAATGGTFTPSNYVIGYVNGVLAVTPAPLTVTASNVAKSYGQTPALTGFTTTALVNGETVGSVTETSPGQVATAPVVGSPYVITPTSATGGTFTPSNYTIGYVNGVLTVVPAVLTVTANDASKTYGQTSTLAPTAFTTTGLVNGDTVATVAETSPGTVATAPVVGSPYPITPSNVSGGTFVPTNYTIGYVNGQLTVIPAPLTVTAKDVTKTFGETPLLTGFTTSPLANGETVGSVTETSLGQPAAAAGGTTYPITPSAATGGTFTPSNYTIGYVNGVLTVIRLPDVLPPGPHVAGPVVPPAINTPIMIVVPVPPMAPPELVTLAPPVVVPVAVLVEEPVPQQTLAVVPVETAPEIYVAPHRPRKQDRN
jgi:filamentous hemagglutinin family protein